MVMDRCTDLVTAACKGISVIFAASASLPIGLEGPLIFIGLSIGEHACRLLRIPRGRFPSLRTDRARRDFCAVGTACGVSAAFYAPIGGVLFALEEGASFWSQVLMWQCFAAASVTLFVSYFWVACESRDFGTPIDFSNIGTSIHLFFEKALRANNNPRNALTPTHAHIFSIPSRSQVFRVGQASKCIVSVCVLSARFFWLCCFGCYWWMCGCAL